MKILVYMKSLNKFEIEVHSIEHAREYARNIQIEGVMITEEENGHIHEVYYPVHQIFKIKIMPDECDCRGDDR